MSNNQLNTKYNNYIEQKIIQSVLTSRMLLKLCSKATVNIQLLLVNNANDAS